jgi:mannose-6-phosphate isomerase class I
MYALEGFWPCPRPAFGTLKPDTLSPIPDVVYYQGQLDEINELTDRIAKLCDALKVKAFYAAGNGDIGTAINLALADNDNSQIAIPVSNFAALGGAKMADAIVWLPIETVALTLRECVEQRRTLMQDVYEITGLSDIMRGATEAQETLGAQQLKAQFGSVRVKERQAEMQRLARDVMRIKAEIMAEHFPMEALLSMSQTEDIPTAQAIKEQSQQLQQKCQQDIMAVVQQFEQEQQQAQTGQQPTNAAGPMGQQPMPQGMPGVS